MSYFSENEIAAAMTVKLDDVLPEKTVFQEGIRRAPDRGFRLTSGTNRNRSKNALRLYSKKIPRRSDSSNSWKNWKTADGFILPLASKRTHLW